MAKTKTNTVSGSAESDSSYFLKLVLYIILGSLWLKFSQPLFLGPVVLTGIPVGLCIGLLIASHDRFQVDRKIEYAVLVVVTVMSFFLPAGIVI